MLPSTTISLMDSNDAMNIKLLRSGTETERERETERYIIEPQSAK